MRTGAHGNAVIARLPPQTRIVLPPQHLHEIGLLFHAETELRDDALIVVRPLELCTPAYIAERDRVEAELLKRLQEPK